MALVVYALTSRIPGSRAPPEELHTAPLGEAELLGHRASPWVVRSVQRHAPQPTPPTRPGSSRQAR